MNACLTYGAAQLIQATAVIEGFYGALNEGEMSKAVSFYGDVLRKSVGDELLKEGLSTDVARLGAFVDYKVRSWSLRQGQKNERQLVLVCEVIYELGRTQEVFTVSVGGEEQIISHEIESERRAGGQFDI